MPAFFFSTHSPCNNSFLSIYYISDRNLTPPFQNLKLLPPQPLDSLSLPRDPQLVGPPLNTSCVCVASTFHSAPLCLSLDPIFFGGTAFVTLLYEMKGLIGNGMRKIPREFVLTSVHYISVFFEILRGNFSSISVSTACTILNNCLVLISWPCELCNWLTWSFHSSC